MSSSPPPDTVRSERTSTIADLVDEPRPEDLPSADVVEVPALAPKRRLRERFAEARGRLVPWRAWTLRAKLVASMLALFTVLSLATGAVTVLTLNNQLTSQVDEQLNQSILRNLSGGPLPDFNVAEDDERRPGGPGDEGLIAFLPTQPTSLFTGPVGAATSLDKDRRNLTSAQLSILANSGLGRDATDVQLGGSAGNYRVVAAYTTLTPRGLPPTQGTPGVLIVGLPLAPNEHTVQRMAAITITTVAAGIVLVFVLGSWIVRRNLEPLQRVADTATRVSRMPLASGKVALAERVDPADTDTRTEVGQVGAALNEMLDHVDEALNSRHQSEQRVRQFVADASHELRTPLASIKGYAELSRREPEEVPTSVTHAMGRIESEANRMSSLVEDLLLLARLDAGRPLEQKPVDLSMIVINAVSDAHAASPDHVWDLDLPPEPIEVTGDTARLHQVAANLLANARTHTPAGTRVTTSIRQDADWVRLTVHDNGPGVPEALQPNVFERFARGDDARNRSGGSTGLGLSIVAAVAKALGGRVELHSRPGDTTFTVFLPATLPAPTPAR
ncbi:sensor histidine kinase [Humibacillus xanthopallidus]|uniref:histidine kinase n=1 Tax=Humibacillus xanthopallidus TaxID=412689 RepID=A0A543HGL7_9MICO|nr:HAMP domain-containing sensor histidine kinase [Humibacillus xanthopallidus]TQM57470.1 two-component system OmpR family sensor kinase [Humibacillus xanthopallidus]